MFELLHEKMKEYVAIEDADLNLCSAHFQAGSYPKGSLLLREGEVCRFTYFVEKGSFRTYVIGEQGTEHILQFSLRGWWLGDLGSFHSEKPSRFMIEALEDSEVLQISKPSWDQLVEAVPALAKYHRKLIENSLIATQNRLIQSFSIDAKEKYRNLLQVFPDIFQIVPQYMIASYLGMSRETLSRVRNQLAASR